jgi:hypothetical protein
LCGGRSCHVFRRRHQCAIYSTSCAASDACSDGAALDVRMMLEKQKKEIEKIITQVASVTLVPRCDSTADLFELGYHNNAII